MHFERAKCLSKYINYVFFLEKKIIKKIGVPTLPKIFRLVTRNTLICFWSYETHQFRPKIGKIYQMTIVLLIFMYSTIFLTHF